MTLGFLAFAAPLAAALVAFAVPLLGVRAYEYVMASGYFTVRTVLVDNAAPGRAGQQNAAAARRSREEVLAIAGIGAGTHVLEADLDAMAQRLVADPWIRWAKVERELPDTLVVHVIEHRPVAYLAADDLYLVDELGAPFALAPADFGAHLPVISGVDPEWPERLGDAADAPALTHELAIALNILRAWHAQGLSQRYPVGELRLQGGGAVAVVLEGRTSGTATEIVLGRAPFREKLFRLEWVLEHLRSLGKSAEYILLDVADDTQGRGIDIGGARVVVKSDLGAEALEPDPIAPVAPAADATKSVTAPVTAPTDDPLSPEPDDPTLEGGEAAPVSGGRPAADPADQ